MGICFFFIIINTTKISMQITTTPLPTPRPISNAIEEDVAGGLVVVVVVVVFVDNVHSHLKINNYQTFLCIIYRDLIM